jgi:hypothetical protein
MSTSLGSRDFVKVVTSRGLYSNPRTRCKTGAPDSEASKTCSQRRIEDAGLLVSWEPGEERTPGTPGTSRTGIARPCCPCCLWCPWCPDFRDLDVEKEQARVRLATPRIVPALPRTGGALPPIFSGDRTFFYPEPSCHGFSICRSMVPPVGAAVFRHSWRARTAKPCLNRYL